LFKPADLIHVQPGDVLREDQKKLDFACDIWGKGERDPFLEVLRTGMVGRVGRGRGRGRGRGEEFWGEG
jgi:hypothetical protein